MDLAKGSGPLKERKKIVRYLKKKNGIFFHSCFYLNSIIVGKCCVLFKARLKLDRQSVLFDFRLREKLPFSIIEFHEFKFSEKCKHVKFLVMDVEIFWRFFFTAKKELRAKRFFAPIFCSPLLHVAYKCVERKRE